MNPAPVAVTAAAMTAATPRISVSELVDDVEAAAAGAVALKDRMG